jgi:phosphomannomutase
MSMRKLFGTDGIRGVAGEFPLDDTTVRTIGRALSQQFTRNSGGLRGLQPGATRANRVSGSSGLSSGRGVNGAECKSSGVITTPVSLCHGKFDFDAGIVSVRRTILTKTTGSRSSCLTEKSRRGSRAGDRKRGARVELR